MNLPEESASTADLKAFAASLGDDRRLRLAMALLAPSMTDADAARQDGSFDETHEEACITAAGYATEFDILDTDFEAFATEVYNSI